MVSFRVKIVNISVLTTISSVFACNANIPASLLTKNKVAPELLKLLITVVPLTLEVSPIFEVLSVIKPPAL